MANAKNKGVRYTFAGQYYTGNKEQSEQVKDYTLQVVFPQVYPNALSIFKTSLIKKFDSIYTMMLKKYPDFKTVRTYTVINIEDLNGTSVNTHNIATMNTKQLIKYIENNELGIDAKIYEKNITGLRNAIILAQEEPEKFKEVYAADVQQYEFNKQIKELNNVPGDNGEKEEDKNKDKDKDKDKDEDTVPDEEGDEDENGTDDNGDENEKDIDELLGEADQVGK